MGLLDKILGRLSERNVSDKEITELVESGAKVAGQAPDDAKVQEAYARVQAAASAKMGNKEIEYHIGDISVGVKKGNIAEDSAECIVVPEFNSCASRGGVGYAIEAAGMNAGLDAYDAIVGKKKLNYGDAVITDSGKDGIKLAHVATAGADKDNQLAVVQKAIFNTLVAADELGIKSVAMPELGTGIIGSLTPEQSAKAVFSAVHEFSKTHPSSNVQGVSFVVYRGSTEPAEKVLSDKSYIDLMAKEKGQKEFDVAAFVEEMSSGGKPKEVEARPNKVSDGMGMSARKFKMSHTFQEMLMYHPEFLGILAQIKGETKRAVLNGETARYVQEIAADKGVCYDDINPTTLRQVSDVFFERHKDDMSKIFSETEMETLRKIENTGMTTHVTLDKPRVNDSDYSHFSCKGYFGNTEETGFITELCKGGKPKEGDKLVLVTKLVDDDELGLLTKKDAYRYNGDGKYSHFYQEYAPAHLEDQKISDIVKITKSMQAKADKGMSRPVAVER